MSFDILRKALEEREIPFSRQQEEQFERFAALLEERNKVMNLTAVKSGEETEVRHFIDSLSPLLVSDKTAAVFSTEKTSEKSLSVIDIGSGAGFPGIPLAIMLPEVQFVLTDALHKRIRFLNDAAAECGLNNVKTQCGRFEELARKPEYRESFDVAVSRAVAEFRVLCEYSLPFVKTGGSFLSYKAEETEAEISQAEKALSELSSELDSVSLYQEIGSGKERTLVLVRKTGIVSDRYPRRNGVPSKRPL